MPYSCISLLNSAMLAFLVAAMLKVATRTSPCSLASTGVGTKPGKKAETHMHIAVSAVSSFFFFIQFLLSLQRGHWWVRSPLFLVRRNGMLSMAETMPMLYPHFKGKTLQLFCHLSYNLVIFILWLIFPFLERQMSDGLKMSYNKSIWQILPFPGKSTRPRKRTNRNGVE